MQRPDPGRVRAIAKKEFLHVLRDWRSMYLSIAIPILLIVLFGWALDMDLDNVPTVIWDQSRTPASREFIELFNGSPYFSIREYYDNYQDMEFALENSSALIAIVIPSDFSSRINSGERAEVQVLIDGSDANTGRLAQAYATSIGAIYSQNIGIDRLRSSGFSDISVPLNVKARAWYNPSLQSRFGIIPGIIVIVMVVIAAMLTSVTVAKEWELGTMEQLISTPIRGSELVFGKIVPYFVIGMIDVALSVYLGQWLFGVPLRGSTGLLFLLASVFLLGALFFGLLISINLKKQVLSNQVALLASYLPTMILSGFVFAIENMPQWIQYITYFVPAGISLQFFVGFTLRGLGWRYSG